MRWLVGWTVDSGGNGPVQCIESTKDGRMVNGMDEEEVCKALIPAHGVFRRLCTGFSFVGG